MYHQVDSFGSKVPKLVFVKPFTSKVIPLRGII